VKVQRHHFKFDLRAGIGLLEQQRERNLLRYSSGNKRASCKSVTFDGVTGPTGVISFHLSRLNKYTLDDRKVRVISSTLFLFGLELTQVAPPPPPSQMQLPPIPVKKNTGFGHSTLKANPGKRESLQSLQRKTQERIAANRRQRTYTRKKKTPRSF
jgi:hypothetical protein